ncbi:hypothetical protein ABIB62_002671 [Mucilaginibacter sp. UYP25]|uniref:hypothetical protein n=1 Tax=unclassified Mucilaginibacter TaxID=2617802 RepID=UPI0033940728
MELPSLINQLLRKAAPTTAMENQRIDDDCKLWYETLAKKIKDKIAKGEKPSIFEMAFQQLDSWYGRLILAMSYFFILRFIQDLMNPADDPTDLENTD